MNDFKLKLNSNYYGRISLVRYNAYRPSTQVIPFIGEDPLMSETLGSIDSSYDADRNICLVNCAEEKFMFMGIFYFFEEGDFGYLSLEIDSNLPIESNLKLKSWPGQHKYHLHGSYIPNKKMMTVSVYTDNEILPVNDQTPFVNPCIIIFLNKKSTQLHLEERKEEISIIGDISSKNYKTIYTFTDVLEIHGKFDLKVGSKVWHPVKINSNAGSNYLVKFENYSYIVDINDEIIEPNFNPHKGTEIVRYN